MFKFIPKTKEIIQKSKIKFSKLVSMIKRYNRKSRGNGFMFYTYEIQPPIFK